MDRWRVELRGRGSCRREVPGISFGTAQDYGEQGQDEKGQDEIGIKCPEPQVAGAKSSNLEAYAFCATRPYGGSWSAIPNRTPICLPRR
jgi:hypothetical protein